MGLFGDAAMLRFFVKKDCEARRFIVSYNNVF